jgi:hypothetical protein
MLRFLNHIRSNVYSTFAAMARKPLPTAHPLSPASATPSAQCECRALGSCKVIATPKRTDFDERRLFEKERG